MQKPEQGTMGFLEQLLRACQPLPLRIVWACTTRWQESDFAMQPEHVFQSQACKFINGLRLLHEGFDSLSLDGSRANCKVFEAWESTADGRAKANQQMQTTASVLSPHPD